MIRDRTRLSRLFGTYVGILTKRIEASRDGAPGKAASPKPADKAVNALAPRTSARRTRRP